MARPRRSIMRGSVTPVKLGFLGSNLGVVDISRYENYWKRIDVGSPDSDKISPNRSRF